MHKKHKIFLTHIWLKYTSACWVIRATIHAPTAQSAGAMKMVISHIVVLNPCLLIIAKGIAKIKVRAALPNSISFNVFSINFI